MGLFSSIYQWCFIRVVYSILLNRRFYAILLILYYIDHRFIISLHTHIIIRSDTASCHREPINQSIRHTIQKSFARPLFAYYSVIVLLIPHQFCGEYWDHYKLWASHAKEGTAEKNFVYRRDCPVCRYSAIDRFCAASPLSLCEGIYRYSMTSRARVMTSAAYFIRQLAPPAEEFAWWFEEFGWWFEEFAWWFEESAGDLS